MDTPNAELEGAARAAWQAIARRSTPADAPWVEFSRWVERGAEIHLQFHPYRRLGDGRSVAQALLADGRYRSQFETGISNGSPSAHTGGARDEWERQLFAGAYHEGAEGQVERPKYGALDLRGFRDGAAPRFGCCYFVLKPELNRRASFCWQDSHLGPDAVGVYGAMGQIWAAVEGCLCEGGPALGLPSPDAGQWRAKLRAEQAAWRSQSLARRPMGRLLDDYIEAQVHGPLDLRRDAASLVADSGLRGHALGRSLGSIAREFQVPLSWTPALRVERAQIDSGFRGPSLLAFLERAGLGEFGVAELAWLEDDLIQRLEFWAAFAPAKACQQYLKQAWHALAALGN